MQDTHRRRDHFKRMPNWLAKCLKFFRKHFSGWFVPYILLFVLLFLSWISEITSGNSLCGKHFPALSCPVFLLAPAILELINVLGFSTILIGWVYNSLDAQMLGLNYGELLTNKFTSYHACSVAHICATIACILSATADTSESAIISLVAVLYGFLYQWIVLYQIILNPKSCEKVAMLRWQSKIDSVDAAKRYLPRITSTLPEPDSEHHPAHCLCFAQAFIKYCEQETSDRLIHEVAYLWSSIFEATKKQNRLHVVTQIIGSFLRTKNMDNISLLQRKNALNVLLSGYLVNYLIISSDTNETSEHSTYPKAENCNNEEVFVALASDIARLSVCLYDDNTVDSVSIKSVIDCLKTNYCILGWVYFQNGNIKLFPEIRALNPDNVVCDMAKYVVFSLISPVDDDDRVNIEVMISRAIIQCQNKG